MKAGRLRFALCLLFLHAISCLPMFLGDPAATAFLRVSPDLAIAVAMALLGAAAGWRKMAAFGAALWILFSLVYGATLALWPVYFDAQFHLADAPRLAGLFHLLFDNRPVWVQWVALVTLWPALLLVCLLLARVLSRVVRVGGTTGFAVWCVALQGLVLVAVVRQSIAPHGSATWHPSSLAAFAGEVASVIRARLATGPARANLAGLVGAEKIGEAPADLLGLAGADVHVMFLESYGRAVLRHPEISAKLRSLWPELTGELATAGFMAASGACRPMVSGGGSSLAHAQLLTGVPVVDYPTVERLFRSTIRPLPMLFQTAGYQATVVMPAVDVRYAEMERFYGFTDQVTQAELAYDGFTYHFGRMPDQYALHHLLRHVVEPATKPLFTMFVSVTSHLPCTYIPPYVADWRISGETFRSAPTEVYDTSWFNARYNQNTVPAFAAALVYSLRTVVGFTCRLQRPSLVFVLGDHQPPMKKLFGSLDDSLDVPIHVFSNRPELLAALAPLGLVEGLDVPDALTSFDSADFAPMFLRAFSAASPPGQGLRR